MGERALTALGRPQTLNDVAVWSESLEDFGYNLRDWQHEVSRRFSSRKQLAESIEEAPPLLAGRFVDGDVADAYLAAYAEWLSLNADIPSPTWCQRGQRSSNKPWYSGPDQTYLEKAAPINFSKRGLFAVPDNVFIPRPGRPRVSLELKREKAAERQRAYRKRVKAILDRARAMGIAP
ncbi:hypothetical protein [Pelagicoccus mobilis]|uniref:Uncharacterized protein n=1 Tax=Pelagicoccus mobilis TaxID=415221 RepID=A0A934RVP6_9BACT|nr:hypothetical protein [Pelagicoccus mobilis]MBK1875671.1 hypothetical protein [Pelagicoccus mobilis]